MNWNFDPVLLSLGPITIHWYGAIFATAIFSGFQLTKTMFAHEKREVASLDNLLTFVVAGVIIGARLGHCLFYDPGFYLSNPLKILAIWEGGLASHGGGLGAILAIYLYAKKYSTPFLWLLDRIAITTALFGFFVRVANFLNSEILGAQTNVPWAVIFEKIDNIPRHPAQLYEAIGYLIIFLLLIGVYTKTKLKDTPGGLLGLFLTLTFTVRFLVELVKEPQATYSLGIPLNTGQLLSIPFFLLGIYLLVKARPRSQP